MTGYRSQDAVKPIACGVCGTFIDPKTASYSLEGVLACPPCASRGQIAAAQERGRAGLSINNIWVRVAVVVALVTLRLLLRFSH